MPGLRRHAKVGMLSKLACIPRVVVGLGPFCFLFTR